ncbi:heparin lyase I family protein, partial [Bradyrhizobium sp. 44]|uniref:Ig-like domain-containing protein n=2 Tax=unclassified Bradyrhizobium TaxID=2631580 RepID=UPI001FF89CA6
MAVQTDPPVILAASPDNVVFDKDPGASYSDELLVVGTAIPNSTITVYDGSTLLGAATANSAGIWTYQTSSLRDEAHSFTATATVSGVTSAASSAFTQTITVGISNFSPLTDQWSAPILVGGQQYYVENANVNGNAPWAIKQLDSHTLRFELRPNDIWLDNDSHRSEISGGTVYSATSTIDLSYQFTVQPGFNDTSDSLAWQILGQFHADDNDATYQSIEGGSPPLAVHLTGANGYGEGDYLAIEAFYALPGQKEWTAATLPGDPLNSYLWVSSAPIVRGQPIDVHMEVNFQNNANGFLEVWINGQQVVDYHGPIGYGGGVYWKEGVYEGWSSNQPITVDYSNTVITAKPGAPLILTDVVNGNQVMLSGTSQANSAVSIYDGSTKLGTATASSNGSWFYQTSALSIGSHNLTATATDSAGNVGQASAIASATIAALTAPIITKVATSAPSGQTVTGTKITFTLTMNSVVSVTGTPTLLLNDGGTAVYSAGSGSNSLTFTYTVGANDSSVKGLAIVGADLPNGATIKDGNGIAALLTGAFVQFSGVTIDAQPVKTPVFGDPVDNGNGTFTFTGTAGANTTVYFATPYGVALGSAAVDSTGHWTFTSPTFVGNTWNSIQAYNVNSLGNVSAIGVENGAGFGSSSSLPPSPIITGNALVGSTVTLYGMVTPGYSITKVTVFDGATQIGTATINSDNSWSFSTSTLANGVHNFTAKVTNASGTSAGSIPDLITVGTVTTGTDTTAPTVVSLVATGNGVTAGTGNIGAGSVVTLTVSLSEAVTVAGGTPTLTLNNGGTATYAGGSGSNTLTFSYTVAAGQNTSDLAVTAFNLNAATVKDSAGNA